MNATMSKPTDVLSIVAPLSLLLWPVSLGALVGAWATPSALVAAATKVPRGAATDEAMGDLDSRWQYKKPVKRTYETCLSPLHVRCQSRISVAGNSGQETHSWKVARRMC